MLLIFCFIYFIPSIQNFSDKFKCLFPGGHEPPGNKPGKYADQNTILPLSSKL